MRAADHVADLLPAYLNGTLGAGVERSVTGHLRACAACREELASWEAVGEAATRKRLQSLPPAVLAGALARIGREDRPAASGTRLSLTWQLLLGQMALVRREIWAASGITMAVGCLVAALTVGGPSAAGQVFALFAPVVAAVGVAFVYGPENDPSLEIALSTPTSPRLVLIARLVLVYGYDLLLALAATAVIAATKGSFEVWPLVSFWIGPMLFLSALALLVSLLASPTAAVLVALSLWGARLAASQTTLEGDVPAWAETARALWHAEALLLPLATLLLAAALLYAPRVAQPNRGRLA